MKRTNEPRSSGQVALERRGSVRTRVSLGALLRAHGRASVWNVVELSHTGMLLQRKTARGPQLPGLVRAVLDMPGGPVTLWARPVWARGRSVALSTLAVAGDGESRLVDFLFELMHQEQVPARSGVRASAAPLEPPRSRAIAKKSA